MDKKLVYLILASGCLSAAGSLPFNLGPLIFSEGAEAFGFGDQQIGLFSSAYTFGFAISSILLYFIATRINWFWTMVVGIALGAAAVLTTISIPQAPIWIALWFAIGIFIGPAYSLVVPLLAGSREPARALGGKMALETGIPALLLVFLPLIGIHYGYKGVAIGAAIILLLLAFPALLIKNAQSELAETTKSVTAADAQESNSAKMKWLLWASIIVVSIYYGAQIAVWTFALRAATEGFGYAKEIGSILLPLAKAGAAIGGVVSMILAERHGRLKPHAYCFLTMLIGQFLMITHFNPAAFVTGAFFYEFSWAFAWAYIVSTIGYIDLSKRIVVIIPAAMTLGGSYGPALAGYIVESTGAYEGVFIMGAVAALINFLFFRAVAVKGLKVSPPEAQTTNA